MSGRIVGSDVKTATSASSATGGAAAGDILLSTAAAGAQYDTITILLEVHNNCFKKRNLKSIYYLFI